MTETTFYANGPSVIGEVLGGEAIIVNLESGAYYSLDGAGAEVWTAAQSGATLAQVIDLAVARFSGVPATIAADVTALVEELVAEGLLVAGSASTAPAADPSAVVAAPLPDRPPFVKPILEKYTDMADLLLLDPIHEVDEQGWPHPAPRA
ncbi:MAG: PqqD family protein [Chloroflexi bacterium]|nr:PqqD family protein [Chloroflexota bacterium]